VFKIKFTIVIEFLKYQIILFTNINNSITNRTIVFINQIWANPYDPLELWEYLNKKEVKNESITISTMQNDNILYDFIGINFKFKYKAQL